MQLFFITFLGAFFRLFGIGKPEGLWNDEYVSWAIASTPYSDGFVEAIKSQCHMPFYYLYLKMAMFFGGQSDLFLRFTSFVPGVLSIIVMYFVGLQKDKRTAILASLFTAISSFLIYYSQEVRFYSLLFFFSALSLLYFLRFIKNKTATNLGGLILADFLILFTHTIGFVFVFFQLVAFSVLFFRDYKKQFATLWISLVASVCLFAPMLYGIMASKTFSQWWGHFSISKIGFLFTDYFSPILTNLVNAPDKFLYNNDLIFLIFLLAAPLIAIIFIGKAIYKDKENLLLFFVFAATIIVMSIAAIFGKLVFITKYSIEIYPILLYLAAIGASKFEKKYIANVLVSVFCVLNIFFLILSPISAPKKQRAEGHKLVANMVNKAQLQEGDYIITEYYQPDRFTKYINLEKYNVIPIAKGNFQDFLTRDTSYSDVYRDGKSIYRPIFAEEQRGFFEYKLKTEVLDKLKQNQSVLVIINKQVALYPQDAVQKIAKDDYAYEKIPLMFLIFSYVNNHSIDFLTENLQPTRIEQQGAWQVIKFTKLKK